MRIIFFGSDDFAGTHLRELIHSRHEVLCCVTQPDRPKGRGLKVAELPIKQLAVEQNIPVYQPEALQAKDFIEHMQKLQSDIFVVVAFGKILPEEILNIPKLFCVNVHGSLLPKYRGASPIHWAVLSGDEKTGVTIIKMNAIMDAGDIIAQAELNIDEHITAVELRQKMSFLGAELLVRTLNDIEQGNYTLTKQMLDQVTYAPKLTKELGHIHWEQPAREIHNLVRGLQPWPGAYTYIQGKAVKILETAVVDLEEKSFQNGEITKIDKEGFVVAASKCGLLIKKIHPESAKPMHAKSFAVGHRLSIGTKLG